MTNKERLEEVISRWNRERDDYDWLVEQARQVEYFSRIIDSQNQSLAELMVENKRYREAIEDIKKRLESNRHSSRVYGYRTRHY